MNADKKKLIYKGLAITFAVMFFSLLLGEILYNNRVNSFTQSMDYLKDEIEEEKLFISFLNQYSTDANVCGVIESYMGGLSNKVYDTGARIEKMYDPKQNVNELKNLQKDWVYLNLELWLRLDKYKKLCNSPKDVIIYFYPYQCQECAPYTVALNRLTTEAGDNLWLFSIPSEVDVKMVSMLMKYYKVKNVPSIVFNGKLLKGTDKDIIKKLETEVRKNKKAVDKKNKKNIKTEKAPK